MKLNLILFLLLIIFALAKVNAQHQSRTSYTSLEEQNKITIDLKDEKNKLQIEESDKSGNERIEIISKKKLKMQAPTKNQIIMVTR
jgi:cell division protein FtsL